MNEAGCPLAANWKLLLAPAVKVVVATLVNVASSFTVRVNFCVAGVSTPLETDKVNGYTPPVPTAGVPDNAPVFGSSVTPVGNAPEATE